jgi:hypothetical protein
MDLDIIEWIEGKLSLILGRDRVEALCKLKKESKKLKQSRRNVAVKYDELDLHFQLRTTNILNSQLLITPFTSQSVAIPSKHDL